jgi:hypothetical protein
MSHPFRCLVGRTLTMTVNAGGGMAAQAAGGGPISWRSAAVDFGLGGLHGVAGGISSRLGLAEEVDEAGDHNSLQRIISGSDLGNPEMITELTANGSNIADWGKYSTPTFQSPSGPPSVTT